MKIQIDIEIAPFPVPDNVLKKQSSPNDGTKVEIPLKELSSNDLERMCDDFRTAVFEKAGKPRPPQRG